MSVDFDRAVEEARSRNGHEDMDDQPAQPTRMRGPRAPDRTEKWVTMPAPYGDTDPPHKIKIWVNYPNRLQDDLASGDEDLIYAAQAQIVVEHNGWCDEDGNPLPLLKRGDEDALRKFWGLISNECAQAISVLAAQQAGKVSASIMNREMRRRGR
jgi:hypothetical protein